jgi:hypothetical protein
MIVKAAYDVTQKNGKFLGFVPLLMSTLAVGSVLVGLLAALLSYMINSW